MTKIPLRFVTNPAHSKILQPYRERRSEIEATRYEVDISKMPRSVLQLAAAYLDEDAWIALKHQSNSNQREAGDENFSKWLAYYADILRFQDLDEFAQSSAIRKKWFDFQNDALSSIASGKLPLNPKRLQDESWHQLCSAAEDGANKKNAPPTGFVSLLLLLGTEWRNNGKETQFVVCALPALMHLETGELAPSEEPFCLNTKHLSSEDRDARNPRIGTLQLNGTEPGNTISSQNNDAGDRETVWQTHWDKLNAQFIQFQDKKPAQTFQTFSWATQIEQRKLSFLGVAAYTAMPGANRRLIALTDDLQITRSIPLLLKNILNADARHYLAKPSISWNSVESDRCRSQHVGHMGGDFGLDDTQRKALWQCMDSQEGEIVGVSGPPGTGKTSMLQGVIGTLVVQAALRQMPCVIIATSQTNQATTNMINAFGTIAKPYDSKHAVSIEHRWIDGFPSYGWYFPSASKKGGKHSAYQELFREKMYDPSLLAGGKSLNEDESPRSVSMVTKEEMQLHQTTFNERFRSYLKNNPEKHGQGNSSASAYLHSRVKELVGAGSELERALHNVESVFQLLQQYSYPYLVESAQLLKQLESRILPHDNVMRIQQLENQVKHIAYLVERVKQVYVQMTKQNSNVIARLISFFQFARNRLHAQHYQQLKSDLISVDITLVVPDTVDALPDFALVIIDKLSNQVEQLKGKVGTCERRQRRREQIQKAIHERRRHLEPLVSQLNKLNRHVEAIAKLFDTHRNRDVQKLFKAGVNASTVVDGTRKMPIYQLGLQIHHSLRLAGPENISELQKLRQQLECVVDITVRYEAFHVAMRYWEARWIEEASSPLSEDPQQEARMALERACMLAPVVVATTQTMPALSLYLDHSALPQHALEIADWLVMDESGQVPPQLSIPLTALAHKALAVGDVKQLEPVVTIDHKTNLDLRRRYALADKSSQHQRESLDALKGNFMACAQFAASRHDNAERGQYGVMLKYHYRCRKTIIEFCNRLVYDAIEPLVPMIPDAARFARTPNEATADDELLPPMGFVAIEGKQYAKEASQINQEEINAIIGWLKENRASIKQRYGSVEKAVAVIAPYGAQVRKLKEALSASGFKVRQFETDDIVDQDLVDQDNKEEMVVGTVHSLQGAEKEIVLFSTVNDPTGKIFIDRKASMLNVAVSRAKHAFIVFGHPGVILKPSGSCSGILAAYLLEFGYRLYPRDLYILESQTKTQLVEQAFGKIARGIATVGHIRDIDVAENGNLRWRNRANAEKFLTQLHQFISLGRQHYDNIYLATDDDREGEAIAWHVMKVSKQLKSGIPIERIYRLRFYAMTPAALIEGKQYVTRGVDPLRVKGAIARAMADKLIAIEIQKNAHVPAGRVSAGLLDEIDRLEREETSTRFVDTVLLVANSRNEPILMTRLEDNDPLGNEAIFANPNDSQLLEQIEDDLVQTHVVIHRIGPLLREERAAPPTSTAEVLHRVIQDLNMSPMQAMNALQEMYSGEPAETVSEGVENL